MIYNLIIKKKYYLAKIMYVMRSIWFKYNGDPLEEKSSDLIEQNHFNILNDHFLNLNNKSISNERN